MTSYSNLSKENLTNLRIMERSLRSEIGNKSLEQSVRNAAKRNLDKVIKEIRRKTSDS